MQYTLGRVPIGGTDFSTHPYTYDDLPRGQTDPTLLKFALAKEDLSAKVRERIFKERYRLSGWFKRVVNP